MSSDDSSASSILNYAPILPNGRTKRAKQRKMDFFDECLDHTQARAEVQRRMAEGGETKEEVAASSSQPLESEDSYWARVEQFTVKTAKRRRLDGSDTDEEEMGQWKDGKGWSREQRRGEAVAKWTGGQGGLGLRRTLVHSSTRKVTLFPVFSSREEALTNLTSLLDQLSQRRKGSPSEQLLDQLLLRPFIQWIQTSKQLWGRGRHSIYTFLDRNPILSSSRHVDLTCECESKCVLVLPDLLVQWLWTMACSSLGGTTMALERKCCRIVTSIGAKRRWSNAARPSIETERRWSNAARPSIETERSDVTIPIGAERRDDSIGAKRRWSNAERPSIETERRWSNAERPSIGAKRRWSNAERPSIGATATTSIGARIVTSLRTDSVQQFQMGDLATGLVHEFGLLLGTTGPSSSILPSTQEEDEIMQVHPVVDVPSLQRLFLLWIPLLQRDCVVMRNPTDSDGPMGQGATQDLVALARVCLDPHFEMATQRYKFCGDNVLLDTIQVVWSSLVDSTVRQITNQFGREHVETWIETTAIAIIESCSTFSAGDAAAADSDDIHGYLPFAAILANIQCHDTVSDQVSNECALLKLHIAEKALRVCLTDMDDLDGPVKKRMETRCESWAKDDVHPPCWRLFSDRALEACITAEVAFQWIDDNKDKLLQDLPLFLAAVHIASDCVMASARIFFRLSGSFHDDTAERVLRYTTEQQDIVYETLSRIQNLSDSLKSECSRRSVISYPHLRRAKEHLTRFTKCIEEIKGRSSKEKRQKRRAQGSLDIFFRSSRSEFEMSPLA